jgi:CheY-like chemotaxis protein
VMDGQTATRTLRARGCTLPILALTANAMKGFERELEEAGFSGFQTKPVDVDSLLLDLAQRLGGQPVAGVEADDSALTPPAMATPAGDDVAIVSRLANRPKFAGIVTRFVEQLPARLAAVETAAAAGRMEDLMALAHGLKGAGGSMGFDEMFEPARALETAAASGDVAAVRTALADLQRIGRGIQSGALATPLNMQEATA